MPALRSNLVNVDGADATDNSINGVRSTVSQEAVQEFQIITNNYAAEYGRAAGGVVNIITRSGIERISRRCLRLSAQSQFSGGESVQHGARSGLYASAGWRRVWWCRSRKTRRTISSLTKSRDATRPDSPPSGRAISDLAPVRRLGLFRSTRRQHQSSTHSGSDWLPRRIPSVQRNSGGKSGLRR